MAAESPPLRDRSSSRISSIRISSESFRIHLHSSINACAWVADPIDARERRRTVVSTESTHCCARSAALRTPAPRRLRRSGALGQYGSIAIVERFILTLRNECTRVILVPLRREAFRVELTSSSHWYNQHRSHSASTATGIGRALSR